MEGARSYLEWIVRATASVREKYPIQVISPEEVVVAEVAGQMDKAAKKEALEALSGQAKPSWVKALEDEMAYVYPYASVGKYKNKYSVSEIKHDRMEKAFADDQSVRPDFLKEETKEIVPAFIAEKKTQKVSRGALRGTAMHRFMECFDFCNYTGRASLEEQAERMLHEGRMDPEQKELLQMDRLYTFMETGVAKRMMQAAGRHELYVEKPFVMSVFPQELFDEEESDSRSDTVLVQGIIDVFFVEEDGIVLLDYKTDRVQQAEELVKRYQAQLQLYALALGRTMDLPVKEILIYSFYLEKMIAL